MMDSILSSHSHTNGNNSAVDRNKLQDSSDSDSSTSQGIQLRLRKLPEGFAELPRDTLAGVLEPVIRGLQQIDPMALLELEACAPTTPGAVLVQPGIYAKPIHEQIEPPSSTPVQVRYIHLSELNNQYSMGIFIFPPNARIPLHDHPGMCVLSRLLYGDLERLSMDVVQPHPPTVHADKVPSRKWWGSLLPETNQTSTKQACHPRTDRLVAPGTTMLFPVEGNLHEFVAGPQGAAVLDVLLPPYDHDDRDCHFYKITKETTDGILHLKEIPPEETCIGGTYRDMGT